MCGGWTQATEVMTPLPVGAPSGICARAATMGTSEADFQVFGKVREAFNLGSVDVENAADGIGQVSQLGG